MCLSTSVMEPLLVVFPRWPDERAVGERASVHSLLSQSEEDHADVARLAPVEAERELIQIPLEVLGLDPAVAGADEPSLQQGNNPMHGGQQPQGPSGSFPITVAMWRYPLAWRSS